MALESANQPAPTDQVQIPPALASLVEDNGRLNQDVPCLSCGYNLRGLQFDTCCPECGLKISDSMLKVRLAFQDAGWLGRLKHGVRWCVVSHLFWPIGMILKQMLWAFAYPGMFSTNHPGAYVQLDAVSQFISVMMVLVSIIGYWTLTTPSPNPSDPSRRSTYRIVGRWALLIAKTLFVTNYVLDYTVYRSGVLGYSYPSHREILMVMLPMLGMIAWAIGVLTILRYQHDLALRIPKPQLARQFRLLSISYTLGALAWAFMIASIGFAFTFIAGSGVSGTILFGIVILALPVTLWIWELILLIRQYRLLSATARIANQTRAATPGIPDGQTLEHPVAGQPV